MSYRIRLQPSGRTFYAEPHENLLEAALRAGVNVAYNCASGSCGECRARLLDGVLEPVRFHDFSFSEAEKTQGWFLLCSCAAGGELSIEVDEATNAAAIPEQCLQARVTRVETLPGGVLMSLRTPRTRTLRFLAGQWVRLIFPDGNATDAAVASCPCNGMVLQFLLERMPSASVGDTLTVRGPYGGFVLDERARRPLWLVAEGTDFAPIKSLAEHALALELPQAIRLVWIAERGQHSLANHARALADAVDTMHFIPLEHTPGVIDVLASLVEDGPASDVYIAAGSLAEAIAEAFIARGTPSARLFRYRA